MNQQEYSILVVEDDREIRQGIEIYLRNQGYQVFQAANGQEGLEVIKSRELHLVILDVMMPVMDGITMLMKTRDLGYEFPVLMLSAKSEEVDKIMGLNMGADDYISKPFSLEVLRKKVHAILKRTGGDSPRMKYKSLEIDTDKCLVLLNGEEIHLTATEYKLLLYLIQNKGKVVTKTMLLEHLWDIDGNFVDDNTIRVNIKRLRQKLNDEKQEYIVTVFGMGYTFGE